MSKIYESSIAAIIVIFLAGFVVGMLLSIPLLRPDSEIIEVEAPCILDEDLIRNVIEVEEILKSQLCVRNGFLPDRDVWSGMLKGCIILPEGF